jgi:CHC2-type zinc finger protein
VTVDEFLGRLEQVRRNGRGWTARCPAHEDRTPSLSVREGDDGRILVHCFAGCTADKITAALGLRLSDLYPGPPIDWSRFVPRTAQERQAAELRKLRRHVRALELERKRAMLALHRASLLVAIAYSDDADSVLERLWDGAVAELEREAAAAADAAGREPA